MSPLKKAYYVLSLLGPRFVWLRMGLRIRDSLGLTRRTFKPQPWTQIELASIAAPGTPTTVSAYARFKRETPPVFLFPLAEPPAVPEAIRTGGGRRPALAERIRLLGENRCVCFCSTPSPEVIDWHENPFDGTISDPNKVWCDIPDFHPDQGDARMLWEPSRAAWAIDLARARGHSIEVAAGELLWKWLDSWMTSNPPFNGFQWKCGQESAVRMIALALGVWSTANDAMTPDRWVQFARLAWATGYRIAHHIDYAISQKNNHALSEACGLLLVSHLFPEFRDSPRWQAIGRKVLTRELRRQVYADGSYLQHSMNYHRVMQHTATLALRLGELAGRPFERDLYDRLARSGEFLFEMMDPETGRLPNYGHNDGANILPLSECDFTDYRPVIQASHYLTTRKRLLPSGPWDEDLAWLFGSEALEAEAGKPREPVSTAFELGGYYTLRGGESWAMIRCHTYHDRPGQYDPLHVDLWWRGLNLLQDCGTYRYYVPDRPDIERYFKSIAAHNTVEIDGQEPLELVSRFLRLPWPRARKRHFEPDGDTAIWVEGEQYDYDRSASEVLHRRAVISLPRDVWVIADDLLGHREHQAVLRWHTVDAPYEVNHDKGLVIFCTTEGKVSLGLTGEPPSPLGFEVVRGRDTTGRVQGFASRYYGTRDPIPTIEASISFSGSQRLVTVISPGDRATAQLAAQADDRQQWQVSGDGASWLIDLARPARGASRMLLGCRAAEEVYRGAERA